MAVLTALAGCYDPHYESCRVACAADTDCAHGHSCVAGLCTAANVTCSTMMPDAAVPSDAPVSPVGRYTLTLTNAENGCRFPDWKPGATAQITIDISQSKSVVIAQPTGSVAALLDAWLGTHVFAGSFAAGKLQLVLAGTRTATQGDCTYTFDATFAATLDGSRLSGNLVYQPRTTTAGACGGLAGCMTRQTFDGNR